jgi:Secretion system C-terminal sorting domain
VYFVDNQILEKWHVYGSIGLAKNPTMKHFFILCFLLSVTFYGKAQINAYASVSAISGTTLTLSSINQTYHTFNSGDQIIIMQMQDNVAGSNTTNTAAFGTVSTIANAGRYEIATIGSVAGLPGSITITAATSNIYTIGSSSSVQIISFRKYGSPDYTTTAAITALPWNGKIGGVVAMKVAGTLTVAYSITADGAGFRGGSVSSNYEVNCEPGVYASNSSNYAAKGEGIQVNATGFLYGRSSLGNGGGGGSDDNGGGGGGSNYTAGGQGGAGWTCAASPSGGAGGNDISTYIYTSRVFMGGGGGGGQQNNSVGSSGGNGGGLIILQANVLTTSCTGSVNISAGGITAPNSGNDGSGGGGAGGSIIMSVGSFNAAASCPLTVQANGGNGGNVTNSGAHGGGGGGGQGVIIYPTTLPTTNITSIANNGQGGNNDNPVTTVAGSAAGTNSMGVLPNMGLILLPVTLTDFSGRVAATDVLLTWKTGMEQGNDHFNVERSTDGAQFGIIGTVQGVGNSNTTENYSYTDHSPDAGTYTYRLQQVDRDGAAVYSPVVVVEVRSANVGGTAGSASKRITVFPNPVIDQFTVQLEGGTNGATALALVDMSGKTVFTTQAIPANGQIHVSMGKKLIPGIYMLCLNNSHGLLVSKIMVP